MVSKLTIILLFCLSLFVRVYNFPGRINFGLEQGLTLSTTASYLNDKITLLGMPNVARMTHDGHSILINPLYNYLLMPFMLMLGKDPIILTGVSLVINLFTALTLYLVVKKLWGTRLAFFSTFFFLFNLTMIEHSLTIWIHNIEPWLGLMSLYFLVNWQKRQSWQIIFYLALLSGVGYAMEYIYLFTYLGIGLYLFVTAKNKWSVIFWYAIGFLIPQLPVVLFDVRHDWYNLRTLWVYTLDTIANPVQSRLGTSHFLQFYPLMFIGYGYLTDRLFRLRPYLSYGLMLIYLTFTLTSPKLSLNQAIGTAPGMDAPTLMNFSQTIANDLDTPYYNVVYLPQSENRAYALRYLLTYLEKKPPMGIEAYPSADVIYVVGERGLDLLTQAPWEASAFGPKRQTIIKSSPNGRYLIYKLTR